MPLSRLSAIVAVLVLGTAFAVRAYVDSARGMPGPAGLSSPILELRAGFEPGARDGLDEGATGPLRDARTRPVTGPTTRPMPRPLRAPAEASFRAEPASPIEAGSIEAGRHDVGLVRRDSPRDEAGIAAPTATEGHRPTATRDPVGRSSAAATSFDVEPVRPASERSRTSRPADEALEAEPRVAEEAADWAPTTSREAVWTPPSAAEPGAEAGPTGPSGGIEVDETGPLEVPVDRRAPGRGLPGSGR